VPGYCFAPRPNWVDDGAIGLGIASYAIVDAGEALVYDTHVSIPHARAIRSHLEALGVRRITVVLSHWHLDHVAGTEVFAECPVIANARTRAHLVKRQTAIEAGTEDGEPKIAPLILPNVIFAERMSVRVGSIDVELMQLNIHSDDATVLWLPASRLLLAGDTVEDTVTYVVEPQNFDDHIRDLDRLWALDPTHILPSHGAPETIACGGYSKTLIRAQQQYIRFLKRSMHEPELRALPLKDVIAGPLGSGWVTYHEGYEAVHASNLKMVAGLAPAAG
jgi:cyclase